MSTTYEPEHVELKEIGHAVIEVLERNQVSYAILYVAHIFAGKPLSVLSQQTGMSEEDIQKRVDYIIEQIRIKLTGDKLISENAFKG